MNDLTERGAAYLNDAAAQGQRLAQDIDGRLKEYTGKSGQAWIKDATQMMKKHPWKAVAVVGLVAYVMGKLRD